MASSDDIGRGLQRVSERRFELAEARARAILETALDCIITIDVDGFAIARELRALPGGSRTVIAALTGWGQPEDRRRTTEAGFDFHLVKPIAIGELEQLLEALPDR